MDDPGISLFQGTGLEIADNNENQEEAEDLEEQIKRREELQNLLINALDEFKYDDSTINSSTNVSVASAECLDQAYKDVQTPYEQLKLLYDIRMKEIQSLKEEFDRFKDERAKEIDSLKRRLTLQEAETSQAEISLRNTKSLLVEKVDIIAEQEKVLASKIGEISSLKELVEQLEFDVQAYKSTVEELQLKFTMETGPYNVAARVFNVEELQNNHKEQIQKMEAILEEQRKKIENLEKDRTVLESDLRRTIANNNENESLQANTITLLNANIESAQNQCKDLLSLVEMLTKENEHYRNRVHKFESNEPILLSNSFKRKSLDYDTLVIHNERLKKMLLDKDVEVNTLKSKTKFYEKDIRELLEYRNIKNFSINKIECNQLQHSQILSVNENEIKKLQDLLQEKQIEVDQLTSMNIELEDKIESMIKQTRNDLENLSIKYKLPELETMNKELMNAEAKIKELQEKLELSEAEVKKLKLEISGLELLKTKIQELDKNSLEQENNIADETNNIKNQLLIKEIESLQNENKDLLKAINDLNDFKSNYELLKKEYKQLTEQLKDLNVNEDEDPKNLSSLKMDLEEFWSIYNKQIPEKEFLKVKIASWLNQVNLINILMKKYKESERSLKTETEKYKNKFLETEKEVNKQAELIEELNTAKILLETEKYNFEIQLTNIETSLKEKIKENKKLIKELNEKNIQLISLRDDLEKLNNEEENVTMKTLEDASNHLEEAKSELLKYQKALSENNMLLKKYEAQVEQLEHEVENTNRDLELSQKEVEQLQNTIKQLTKDNIDNTAIEDGGPLGDDLEFKVHLLKAEVTIQDKLRKEYERKVAKIEDTYKNIFEGNQQKLKTFKEQEKIHRTQLSEILGKYAQILTPVQKENEELKERLTATEAEYIQLRNFVDMSKKEFSLIVQQMQQESEKEIDAWKIWAKNFVQSCLNLEKITAQSRNNILESLKESDSQVQSIGKYYDETIRKYKKKNITKTK